MVQNRLPKIDFFIIVSTIIYWSNKIQRTQFSTKNSTLIYIAPLKAILENWSKFIFNWEIVPGKWKIFFEIRALVDIEKENPLFS